MPGIIDKIESFFEASGDDKLLLLFDGNIDFKEELSAYNGKLFQLDVYENNPLATKIKYAVSPSENTLLYFPFQEPATKEEYHQFPLMDLLMAYRVLRLDDVSALMEELGWDMQYQRLANLYKSDLQYGYVKDLVKSGISPGRFKEEDLLKILCLAWTGIKEYKPDEWLVGKVLTFSLSERGADFEKLAGKLAKYNRIGYLIGLIQKVTGITISQFSAEAMRDVLQKIKYNGILGDSGVEVENDPYSSLRIKEVTKLHRLEQFRKTILADPIIGQAFAKAIFEAAGKVKESVIIKQYGFDHDFEWYTDDLKKELLIRGSKYVFESPGIILERIPGILVTTDKESTTRILGDFLFYTASVSDLISQIDTYELNTVEDFLEAYSGKWFKVDQDYRKAIFCWNKLQLTSLPKGINTFSLREHLNTIYRNFLISLNNSWLKILSNGGFSDSEIKAVKIADFFSEHIESNEVKTVVIISDALRYESAEELLRKLHEDSRNVSNIEFMLSGIPSNTPHGKAALLPASDREFDGTLYLNDQLSTDTTLEREKVLKLKQSDAAATLFKDVINLDQAKGRVLFKSNLVYIYHDRIDSTGDKKMSEQDTFKAVEETIKELSGFISKLQGSWNVTRVIVTSDHGFLYIDEALVEADKEKHPEKDSVARGSRYQILKGEIDPEIGYCFSMDQFSQYKSNFKVVIPSGVNRYTNPGSGDRFVHGGASLQELVVPVITSTRKRTEVTTKVKPILPEKELNIVSGILKFYLIQEPAISSSQKEITLIAGIYDGSVLISDEKKILMNSSSTNPSERIYHAMLTLQAGKTSSSVLKLKIMDIEDNLNPLIEKTVKDKSAIERDFE